MRSLNVCTQEFKCLPQEFGVDNLGLNINKEDFWEEDIEYKDEGYIDLVLKVLAGMCDGQFAGLQVGNSVMFFLNIFPLKLFIFI